MLSNASANDIKAQAIKVTMKHDGMLKEGITSVDTTSEMAEEVLRVSSCPRPERNMLWLKFRAIATNPPSPISPPSQDAGDWLYY